MELTWLGHASFKINVTGKIIYIDPYAGDYGEKADLILISHDHFDHFAQEKIKMIRNDQTKILASRSVASQLDGAKAMAPGEAEKDGWITIRAVAAYNTNKKFHPKGTGIGFILEAENKKLYFAGDTDVIPEMEGIECDIALLPVSGTYVMTAREAIEAVKNVKAKIAIPMHYGKIVGTEDDAQEFKELVEHQTKAQVIILKEGRTIKL